jgi:hypothetical protein
MKSIGFWIIAIGFSIMGFVWLTNNKSHTPHSKVSFIPTYRKVSFPDGVVKIFVLVTKNGSDQVQVDDTVIPHPFRFSVAILNTNVGLISHYNGGEDVGGTTVRTRPESTWPPDYVPPHVDTVTYMSFELPKDAITNHAQVVCIFTPAKNKR